MKIKNNKVTLSLLDRIRIIVLRQTITKHVFIDELITVVKVYCLSSIIYIEYNTCTVKGDK